MAGNDVFRVADYIAEFIANKGIEHVFLLPGGGAMHLIDAAGKHPGLQAVACLHEQAAAIAAEAYGRVHASGMGVAMVTTGPGATNAITAVAGAWIESVPLLIISGQVKRADMLKGAPLRQKGVQEVDIIGMVKNITKYAVTIENPQDIRIEMERAFHLAHEGRAGPVWLDIPLDVQGAPVVSEKLPAYVPPVQQTRDLVAAVDGLLQLLKSAQRPLLLAGHGVRLSGAAAQFRQVAEALQIPVVMTWNAMDLLPSGHPLNVGRPGVVALRAANFAVQNCDLIIAVGSRLDNIITAYNPRGFAPHARKVVVDVDSHEIDRMDMDIALPIVSDANDFLHALFARTGTQDTHGCADWRQRCQDWKARYPVNDGKPFTSTTGISHYQFADVVSDVIPEDTLVSTGSSGLAVEVFYTVFRNKEGQRIFLTSGLGAMGYGLPAAIGACFANSQKPMVAVESDGSLQLNIQELATLRAFNLPICLLIMNNGGYCSIRSTQRNYFNGRFVGTGPEAGLLLPDLEKVAATYDLPFVRITEPETLHACLQNAMDLPRPCLVDVRLVSDEALAPKASAMPQPDGSMLSMPLEDMAPLLSLEVLEREMLVPVQEVSRKVRGDVQ